MSATSLDTSRTPVSRPSARLRWFLALDAAVTGVNGLAYLTASGPVGRLLGIDAALLLGLGGFLLCFAAGVGVLAARTEPPVPAVRAVIAANAGWATASVAVLALGLLSPSTAGTVWVPLQAATVAGFAALQYGGLRAAAA